jgi:hypothetical protein
LSSVGATSVTTSAINSATTSAGAATAATAIAPTTAAIRFEKDFHEEHCKEEEGDDE